VERGSKVCSHCGASNPSSDGHIPGAQLLFAVIVLFGASWLIYSFAGDCSSAGRQQAAEEARNGSKFDAREVCFAQLRNRLLSPSTAQIALEGSLDESVRSLGAGHYWMSGHYDAQNAFGAMLRGNFSCDAQHTTGSSYRIDLQTTR
jgi:hypothetical protein